MSGAPVRSMNVAEAEARPVLGPAGNKTRSAPAARKASPKHFWKLEKTEAGMEDEKKKSPGPVDSPPLTPRAPAVLRRQEYLLRSNLSMNASCSSDASTDSFCSRASTGRIGRQNVTSRRMSVPRAGAIAAKLEKIAQDGAAGTLPELEQGKRRCSWVTANTDIGYAVFHDEEWGVPVHDDRKFFELLVLSGALAELTWPAILSKDLVRRGFRSVGPTVIYCFMQVAGITNDHLISCYRFEECVAAASVADVAAAADEKVDEKIIGGEEAAYLAR